MLLAATADAAAVELPPGFGQTDAITGLQYPTAVRFAPDGRVFAAEKSGRIKVFDSLADPTAEVFANLGPQVHNFHDRGLMSIELHPEFPAEPWVYVLYARDAAIGGTGRGGTTPARAGAARSAGACRACAPRATTRSARSRS